MNDAAILEALLALENEGIGLSAAWDRAHELAQAHEGQPAFDRLHAFLHRIEGDDMNAAYWYRRASEPVYDGDWASECALLIERYQDNTKPS